jgi:plasmid maintenance system antidote protein VapI
LWLNLQTQYELRLAEQQIGPEIRRTIAPRTATPKLVNEVHG